jgi:hypothetical protein
VDTGDRDAAARGVRPRIVQACVGQRIVQVVNDVTVVIDLDGCDSTAPGWILPERPVTAVSSVLVGSTAVTDYTVQLDGAGCGGRTAGGRRFCPLT